MKDAVFERSTVRVSVARMPTLLIVGMGKTSISVDEMAVGCSTLMQLQAYLLHIISQACSERLKHAQLYNQVMGSLKHLCIAADVSIWAFHGCMRVCLKVCCCMVDHPSTA